MAVKISIATGNFLTAGTWGVVDATSYLNAETGSEILTTLYSGTRSSAFTPGAITVSHLAVKLSVRTGTTGTISISLRNATAGLDDFVAGTEVIINCADLPVAATADLNGGWIMFKLATPILLLAATNYNIQAKTSSASQVSLFRDATVDNIARALVTTTTGAPAAGDDLIVAGEKTGAGTSNAFTVTMNETAATDYGAASTSLVLPSLAICQGGTLTYGTTAATNYQLRQSGNAIVYSGGTLNIGTIATAIPRDSTAVLAFDCGADGDFGLTVRNLGTFVGQGLSRTSGKNIVSCKLNTDEATNSTSLGVDTDTGWLDNDEIAVASTTRTASQSEKGTLNGNANASDMTVDGFAGAGGGLAAAHSGTSPTQAEVILITRNVTVRSVSTTAMAYTNYKPTSTVDIDWVLFRYLGTTTTSKGGVEIETTTGAFSMQYCSLYDCEKRPIFFVGSATNNITVDTCTFFNAPSTTDTNGIDLSTATSGATISITNNIFVGCGVTGNSNHMIISLDAGITISGNTVAGCGTSGFRISGNNQDGSSLVSANNTAHSNTEVGFAPSNLFGSTLSNFTLWRNGSSGMQYGGMSSVTMNNFVFFGNTTSNINGNNHSGVFVMNSPTLSGDTTFATTNGIDAGANRLEIIINSGDFSTVAGIKTAHTNDILAGTGSAPFYITLNNTKLGAATEVSTFSSVTTSRSWNSFVKSQKHDQTAATHKTWKKFGIIDLEGTIVNSGSQSMRMLPNSATYKLESPSFYVAVANGATITPSVYVREAAAYNGNRCRLVVKRNDAIGITADTVLDTRSGASDAVFELMTGTTAAATDDGVMEFIIDCDGTAGTGYVYIDSFTVI